MIGINCTPLDKTRGDRNHMIISYKSNRGERLDKFLASRFLKYSRNYFQKLIENNNVLVNNKSIKSKYILKTGDRIKINFIKFDNEIKLRPFNLKLNIIFENDDVIVIDKPAGLTVHPGAGNQDRTLVNALLNYYPKIKSATHDLTNISKLRPGVIHRLDKDTSGVLIVAKNKNSLDFLSKQISSRRVKKIYLAICYGWPKNEQGAITSYLGRHPKNRKTMADVGIDKGKPARTSYKVIQYFEKDKITLSLIEFDIKTGRTHQIRYQAKSIGVPVLGDQIYKTKDSTQASKILKVERQLLHAKEISIRLPNNDNRTRFCAPLPTDFREILR